MSKKQKEAIARLKGWLAESKIDRMFFQNVRHNRNTATTSVQFLIVLDGSPRDWSRAVAEATGYRYSDRQSGVLVAGGGYCKGEHVIELLASRLDMPIKAERV